MEAHKKNYHDYQLGPTTNWGHQKCNIYLNIICYVQKSLKVKVV
jgi:hypothetical protein